MYNYSELPLFRASKIRPPRYCGQNRWHELTCKSYPESSHLAILLNQKVQAETAILLAYSGRKWV